jgi:hypothetical protein
MSPLTRWLLAIFGGLVLIVVIIGIASFGLLALAFGSDSCSAIGGGPSTFFLIASPAIMILGVIVGAILFGLNKARSWWLGALAGGSLLGVLGYVAWFILVSKVWCV